eukprot:TRINITY_DN400_c2_g1_i2.p1 TRINITY_DN400_c2_g1~~TRINITY_DN400_c2_g1_i2.p1  ORF type:complete len:632 (+),score=153.65 TRINITY_DN400_c2_g1_i2:38-1897(+)
MLQNLNKNLPRAIGRLSRTVASCNSVRSLFTVRQHSRPLGLLLSVPSGFSKQTTHVEALRLNASSSNRSVATDLSMIRNVAIIAHVDHGKTTLVDQLLQQSGSALSEERVMDSNAIEKERGITIMAKNTSITWRDYKLNIVDTPGHGDFGGEVERVLSMVDGVVLVVDATEGVMTQTKFVVSKALAAGKRPVVVLNKMDRAATIRVDEVEGEIFDLFMSLGATPEQMDYPTLYASGKAGWATRSRTGGRDNLIPLFEAIVSSVPAPPGDRSAPFSMLVTTVESDNFLGRILTGRVRTGSLVVGGRLNALALDGKVIEEARVTKLMIRQGLDRIWVDEAAAGDIVGIAGFSKASATSTLCSPEVTEPIQATPIDPPVLSMMFGMNSSPLAGKEGTQTTFPPLIKRLRKETESNLSLVVGEPKGESVEVRGRGELQLGVLIENLRREGFELNISPPSVVYRKDDNGQTLEPLEEVTIEVEADHSRIVIEKMVHRSGEMVELKDVAGRSRFTYRATSRALFGLRAELMMATSGTAVMNQTFHSYVPFKGQLEQYRRGALVSMADGVTTGYALAMLEARGQLFVGPGTTVYKGTEHDEMWLPRSACGVRRTSACACLRGYALL